MCVCEVVCVCVCLEGGGEEGRRVEGRRQKGRREKEREQGGGEEATGNREEEGNCFVSHAHLNEREVSCRSQLFETDCRAHV